MARPSILRADTLDLQDQDSPSAAEHSRPAQPTNTGNAPHVAAQVSHVLEERHSEEQALQDAWNTADNLVSDPGAIDQAQAKQAQDHTPNGTTHDGEDGGEDGAETEVDQEDDMMDRISSSPSIDDGGCTQRFLAPMQKHDELWMDSCSDSSSCPTPTRESFNQTANMELDSSPFSQTPRHLPLPVRVVRKERISLVHADCQSSPFDEVPKLILGELAHPSSSAFFASKHHHLGRYEDDRWPNENTGRDRSRALETKAPDQRSQPGPPDGAFPDPERPLRSSVSLEQPSPTGSPFRKHWSTHSSMNLAALEVSPSLSSIISVDLEALLLPMDDPLLGVPPSPNGSQGSWESIQEATSDFSKGTSNRVYHGVMVSIDDDDAFIDLDERFTDSGWGGECLRETEDIDFEFVYALHTFVATVEGQANATKGDTMVLLDDSNSYWWLVRVVKDSSIGYLPAEHIETPTERLARLNKHRNIDLSATMLSDNSEKSRNPLKKAMRRRNAKTVQFAAPTYVEASDYDYSSDEENQMMEPYATALHAGAQVQEEPDGGHEDAKAESKDSHAEGRSSTSSQRASFDREQAATAAQALAAAGVTGEDGPTSPKMMDKTEAAPLKSKRTRNTDSFLKDETIETRKITLTPGILREESGGNKTPTESPRSNSMESLAKTVSPPEQPKKETKEKRKEPKKGGMLSGLFKSKKKEKRSKDDTGSENGDSEKLSFEVQRDPSRASPMTSGKTSPVDRMANGQQAVAVARGYLNNSAVEDMREPAKETNNAFVAELEGSNVAHEMMAELDDHGGARDPNTPSNTMPAQQEKSKGSNPLSPIANMLKTGDDKPKKAKRSKQRVELDDFDTPLDEIQNPFKDGEDEEGEEGDRLSESPVEITSSNAFMHGVESVHIPMPGPEDEGHHVEEAPASLTSSPSLIDHPGEPPENEGEAGEDRDRTPTAPRSPQAVEEKPKTVVTQPNRNLSTDSYATASSQQTPSPIIAQKQAWSDDSFRAWLEDGSEVRDMLVMIRDPTGVKPAPADHPLMAGLYVEQRKGVQDMMSQLDGLLGSYLQRKGMRF